MTFLDLFAGIGGFRLGMEQAGHECVGHCEIDRFANASYMAMHKPREGEFFESDIRAIRANDLPRADVWCFGFPCQDISVAGRQLGLTGNRSSLFFAVTRIIRDTEKEDRPRILFIENVKNLLSVNRGFDFLSVLVELDEIGYDVEWQVHINFKNLLNYSSFILKLYLVVKEPKF
jgi:DNA (cytosine-5)-methyltransferase 1